MLVLSRKLGERILIGDNVAITVVRLKGDAVRIGIDAPKKMQILREEIVSRMESGKPIHAIRDDLDYQENMNRIRSNEKHG